MNTPIVDFVKKYIEEDISRLHMPGHKGSALLGFEQMDITEIPGADVLYSPDGIILESENNAAKLFQTAHSFYTTEGSSLAIKAMLAIAAQSCGKDGKFILAARNVHKAFIHACALLDIDIEWIYPEDFSHLCACIIDAGTLERRLKKLEENRGKPFAVYVTSPDYLGNILDIEALAKVCRNNHLPLLVDNAHGAYLGFLNPSRHPIHLGADMCCDSAHKTLPALTGAGYLHISKTAPESYLACARRWLSVFASTSPSYLILESLDMCNRYLEAGYGSRLKDCISRVDALKKYIREKGYVSEGNEPIKLVVNCKKSGFTGYALQRHLRANNIEVEFFDRDYVVMMFTPDTRDIDYQRIYQAVDSFREQEADRIFTDCQKSKKTTEQETQQETQQATRQKAYDNEICETDLNNCLQEMKNSSVMMSVRQAVFAECEEVSVSEAEDRICAAPSVACPPAVPVVISGEKLTKNSIALLKYYGIEKIFVVKET